MYSNFMFKDLLLFELSGKNTGTWKRESTDSDEYCKYNKHKEHIFCMFKLVPDSKQVN